MVHTHEIFKKALILPAFELSWGNKVRYLQLKITTFLTQAMLHRNKIDRHYSITLKKVSVAAEHADY